MRLKWESATQCQSGKWGTTRALPLTTTTMDLDSQQVELLTSINELDRTVAPEKQDTTRLRLMKQAYNELAEKIRLQKHLFDPSAYFHLNCGSASF